MFTHLNNAPQDSTDGRLHTWHSKPGFTPTDDLLLVHVSIPPGGGHPFHTHPNKEEMIYVIEGEAEQWIGEDKALLGPGSSAYIPKSAVHATFNRTERDLKFIAVITPCSAEGEIHVDVQDQEPWASLMKELSAEEI